MNPREFPLEAALDLIRKRIQIKPRVVLVLGSGLSALADGLEGATSIPFREIPGFPEPGVAGHQGRLVAGEIGGMGVLFQAGRFHLYEGYDRSVVVAPTRIAALLGAQVLILTNAAGSIVRGMKPGSIMVLEDHINFMSRSPLAGPVWEGEERFPEMGAPYDAELRHQATEVASQSGIPLPSGVYAAVLGPSYETPAEVRFLRNAGAHAVGMSTVPETITARALGMRVLAFSLITNMGAGLGPEVLHHEEVLEMGRLAGGRLRELIEAILLRMAS